MATFEEFLRECLDRGETTIRLTPRVHEEVVAFRAEGSIGGVFDGFTAENGVVSADAVQWAVDEDAEAKNRQMSFLSMDSKV